MNNQRNSNKKRAKLWATLYSSSMQLEFYDQKKERKENIETVLYALICSQWHLEEAVMDILLLLLNDFYGYR